MKPYKIFKYSFDRAKKLNVKILPSKKSTKKIDVYKNNKLIAQIGARGYNDYPTWIKLRGKKYAEARRKMYKKRHAKDRRSGNGYWADQILW